MPVVSKDIAVTPLAPSTLTGPKFADVYVVVVVAVLK